VHRWPPAHVALAYWGLGLHWGRAVPTNAAGHLIGHVKDIGQDPSRPDTRLYTTSAAQPFHNDGPADLVALLCLDTAKDGGLSSWCSSIALHNEVLGRPDIAALLAAPDAWFFDRKGEVPSGKKGFFEVPVFNYHKGFLSVNFSDNYFLLSQRHKEVPRLTPAHHEAMALLNSLAAPDKFRMDYAMLPGDIQLLSNHTVFHARSAFVDHDEPGRGRHLLRLWLVPPGARPLPECYGEMMGGGVNPETRGGIVLALGARPSVPLEAG
jgi:hypothetical protein